MDENVQVRMRRHPDGWVTENDFEIVRGPVPTAGPGQMTVRNLWLSIDPYMRGRMGREKSYVAGLQPGEIIPGGAVGQVVTSDLPDFPVGSHVVGAALGWQRFALSNGAGIRRVDSGAGIPLTAYLGAVGVNGVTAHIGLLDIGAPRTGETVVVSAAAGGVGSIAGQIAKIRGCRAVGIAGGPEKCRVVVAEYGFDACVDYHAPDYRERLAAATPNGVDVYFDNVGGAILDSVAARLNVGARIPLCGLISEYNAMTPHGMRNLMALLVQRAKLQGFIVTDDMARWGPALRDLTNWWRAGLLHAREDIVEGIEAAPAAFVGLLRGSNIGKRLVKV